MEWKNLDTLKGQQKKIIKYKIKHKITEIHSMPLFEQNLVCYYLARTLQLGSIMASELQAMKESDHLVHR